MESSIDLVVLTGHRKSGTSLLSRLFQNVSDSEILVYPTDLTLIYAFVDIADSSMLPADKEQRVSRILRKTLGPYHGRELCGAVKSFDFFAFLEEFLSRFRSNEPESRVEIANQVAGALVVSNCTKPVKKFVFKETSQSIFAHEWIESGAKLLNIIRDPRDVFAAIYRGVELYYEPLGEDVVASLTSLLFRYKLDSFSAWSHERSNPSAFQNFRFEDLVVEPEPVVRKFLAFLEIDYRHAFLSPRDAGTPYQGNSFDDRRFDGQISAEHTGKWEDRMPAQLAEMIEVVLGDEILRWGYPSGRKLDRAPGEEISSLYLKINRKFFFNDSYSGSTGEARISETS